MTGRPRDPEREAARQSGAVTYVSAKPCPRGHIGPRYTSTAACRQCVAGQVRPSRAKPRPAG